jgi:hypothetical protein
MTTLRDDNLVCAVCDGISNHVTVGSSNMLESPDLDTRPGEMMRSTMDYWVQECPHCGFCSTEIQTAAAGDAAIVRSDEYQGLRGDSGLNELVRRFLLNSLRLERLGNRSEAGWSALNAAWAADDVRKKQSAKAARNRALALWKQAQERGESFAADGASEAALLVDLYRRARRWKEAQEACQAALAGKSLPKLVADILRFQLGLIETKDAARHRMDEIAERPRG